MVHVISISEFFVSSNREDQILTHALGSCIGLTIFDQAKGVGGMLHYMLPNSRENTLKNPLMYADTAIPLLLNHFESEGGRPNRSIIRAAGGATINDDKSTFRIGEKNILALKKVLWVHNLLLDSADLGGDYYRTLRLDLTTGKTICKHHSIGEWEV